MNDRLYFEDPHDVENSIAVTVNDGSGLFVTVSEERSVDSDHDMSSNTFALNRAQAEALRDQLNHWFPS